MLIRRLQDCEEIIAGDSTILREVLRPEPDGLSIRYSLAHARLPAGQASQRHRLSSSEVYYVLEGSGRMHIDDEQEEIGPGDCVYIPPSAVQYVESTGSGDLVFTCIVDPAWRKIDEEIL